MTNSEIQAHIDEHHDMIVTMALTCHDRLRKPTFYDVDDLVQEGVLQCVQHLPKYNPSASSVKSYIFLCIMTRYTDLVQASWAQKRRAPNTPTVTSVSVPEDPSSVAKVRELAESLTPRELEYVSLSPNSTKTQIRKDMGLSRWHQNKLLETLARKTEAII